MPRTPAPEPVDERIQDIDLSTEMQGSFLEYAYSVIYSRALPDARDGLKPVQRRILFQMAEMGLRPDKGHVKSARVVGEVMGKLHPHGDSAIYDALVRLSQDFALRVPLVDGHGNFGSLDDGPAASRYTEARLAASALALTESLDEDVVDFIPNYDGQFQQPAVLPAAFPNLLVNGASGIAVGMATNMAPHNLIEVVAAAIHLLENPDATTEELMEFVPGPDFPSGGILMGLDGVKDAYANGRGALKVRGKVSVEPLGPRRTGIVVTELPYNVGPERLIEKIRDAVQAKKLQGISDVTDLTDRHHGLRIQIGIKTGFDANAVLEQLYRLTPLEDSFSINNVALVEGQPRTLGLRDLLAVYIKHRLEVITRRSRYRLARREERLHLVEGLLLAILDIDEVIQLIRSSDDSEQARTRLREVFELSEVQAEYILELRLRRLTKFSRIELEAERDKLQAEIAALKELLGSDALLRAQVATELDAAAEAYGTPRRTLLLNAAPPKPRATKGAVDLQIADTPTVVVLSTTGRAVRVDLADGQELTAAGRRSKHDAVLSTLETTTRSEIGAVTSAGRVLRFSPVDLPSVPPASVHLAAGVALRDYIGLLDKSERIIALMRFDDETPLALGTRSGIVKRIVPSTLPSNKAELEIIGMKPGDVVVGAGSAPDDAELVFVTSDAQLLHFAASAVRPQGAPAGGMAGVKLAAKAEVITFSVVTDADQAVVVTISGADDVLLGADAGRAKVSEFAEFPGKGRATGGVRAHALLKGETGLRLAWVGQSPALAVGSDGAARALPESGAKRDASGQALDAVIGSIGRTII
ncbi:DNA gyrase subunit A [Microbacterium keratanolyticum]|uniref:DNA topoisomerase (ATP-hydrolyzing) n=2 Tax=Microbacterium keratanolyticum TaxID=67574 RepID=A0A9W6M954_9MICO|nr:DNA topoisomerase IV subunit A [Microbacterium keratanolyticum]MBM7467506.1 DNA gyrase subunit A [Microbacterium keratanolyticum]GLK02495.1 DNA topoisomerase (ATP-hydrolyzing) [Microbacterium keratanolyticum]